MTRLGDLRIESDPPTRSDWRFQYTAKELAAASKAQADYHITRRDYWDGEATRLEGLMRDPGAVDLREQQATGGTQFTLVLDPQLGVQLNTARNHRDGHAGSARTFAAYAESFERISSKDAPNGTYAATSYDLSVGDVDYFAIHRDPGD